MEHNLLQENINQGETSTHQYRQMFISAPRFHIGPQADAT